MPEYRGVVQRTIYANLSTIADNKKQATQQLREIAELLLPTDYDFAEPLKLYVSPLKRDEPIAADQVVEEYHRTLLDVIAEEEHENQRSSGQGDSSDTGKA